MEKLKISSNIWKLYILKATRGFMLFMPVIVLFFQENGLSMQEVFVLQSLFSVAVIIFEVPSGYLSDILGRKKSIIGGWLLSVIGFAIYAFAYEFWGFLAAELMLGFGASFISGADDALMYDSLLSLNRANEFKKIGGKYNSIGLLSEALACIIGGGLALISLRTPLYAEALVTLAIFPLTFLLVEPDRCKLKKEEANWKKIIKLVKYCLHDHKEIKWLSIYSSLVGASTLTMVWFIQPYLQDTGVHLAWFGIIWAILMSLAAVFSWYAEEIEKFLGQKISLLTIMLTPVLAYFLLGSFFYIWSGIFITLFYFVRGINNTIMNDYINGLVSSDVRATILSVKNLIGRLIFSIIGPIVGYINDAFSMQLALISSGIIFLFFGLIAFFFMKRYREL